MQRQQSVPDDTISKIQNMLNDRNSNIEDAIINKIYDNLNNNNLDVPDNININVKRSGVYIELTYPNINRCLVLVIHSNRGDDNRIHVKTTLPYKSKAIAQNHCIWSDYDRGIILDDNDNNCWNNYRDCQGEIWDNEEYFYAIFGAVSEVYYDYDSGFYNHIYNNYGNQYHYNNDNNYDTQYGGSKNKKINYKNNSVLELKSICKNKKIKNYSKLNKADLIKLLKKNK